MKKILVVDDDQDVLFLVQHILESRGFDVHTHSSGLKVPEVVMNYNPNLILLDVSLPEKSGIEICNELKQIYSIPIILISAYSKHQISSAESNAEGQVVGAGTSPRVRA